MHTWTMVQITVTFVTLLMVLVLQLVHMVSASTLVTQCVPSTPLVTVANTNNSVIVSQLQPLLYRVVQICETVLLLIFG